MPRTAKPAAGKRAAAKPPKRGRAAAAAAPPVDPLEIESGYWGRGVRWLAGVDEVGRGPLAGPVVAAAVLMPPGAIVAGAGDSKKLTAEQRGSLVDVICAAAVCFGFGAASAREIDRVNIRVATALAMRRAVARLRVQPEHLLIDGLPVPELGADTHTAIVDGDERVHMISCASILAKVLRDRLMTRLAPRYAEYGWDRNKGYATPEHIEALLRHGPTPHHRRTFSSVIQLPLGL